MTLTVQFIIGCSSKIDKAVIGRLKPTERVEVKFVKNDDKFCSDANNILKISKVIGNLRYNQSLLTRAITGGGDE